MITAKESMFQYGVIPLRVKVHTLKWNTRDMEK